MSKYSAGTAVPKTLSTAISQKSLRKNMSSRLVNTQVDTLITVPPDGGWGWVIVVCAFCMAIVVDGISYSIGLFIDEISTELKCTKGQVSICASILTSMYYMCGPIVSAMVNRLGFRIVCIIGIFIAATGLVAASFMNDYLALYFTFGLLGGAGFCMMFTTSTLIVGFYFQKWRALATGMASCGTSIGLAIVPPIISTFLSPHMTWRTIFQLFSGLTVLCVVPACMYRPLRPVRVVSVQPPDKKTVLFDDEDELSIEQRVSPFSKVFDNFHNSAFPTTSDLHDVSTVTLTEASKQDYSRGTSKNTSANPSRVSVASRKKPFSKLSVASALQDKKLSTLYEDNMDDDACCVRTTCCNCMTICCMKCCLQRCKACDRCCYEESIRGNVSRPMYRDDIFYHASLARLPEYKKSKMTNTHEKKHHLDYNMSVTRVATQRDLEGRRCACCPESVSRILVTMLDMRLMKQLSFALILISGLLTCLGLPIPYTFLIDRAVIEHSMKFANAAYLLTTIGCFNAIGRLLNGSVSCIPQISPFVVTYVSLITSGVFTLASPYMPGATWQFVYAAVYGFTVACICIRAVLIVELVGLDKLTNAFGIMMLFYGIGSLLSLMGGILVDQTHGFEASFYFSGTALLLSGLIIIPIPYVKKWEMKKQGN